MAGSTIPPATIGRFKVEALLGSGGMGEVYKAHDATLRRTVAIKTVRPDIKNPSYLERLYREAQAGARLQHPNIVTVFEAGEVDGLVYIAMEFLKGESLASAMERGDLSFDAKIKIVMQVLDALQYAHREGVVHRDIKPANVHRVPDGSIKLLDFGLARVDTADQLTRTGAIMGTPFYASPEQLRGETVDARTDIYSTGVMAYEMLTGRRAFDGENLSTVMLKVLSEPAPPMETAWSNAFPEIERIISRGMAKAAADRFATAEDMKNALSTFISNTREMLASIQAEQTIIAQRAVIEAKSLIARGEVGQAQELLQQTLRSNPDASAARSLLKDTTLSGTSLKAPRASVPLATNAPTVVGSKADNDQQTATPPRPIGATAAEQATVLSQAGKSPLLPPPPVQPVAALERSPEVSNLLRRTTTWVIGVAAVMIAAVAVWMTNTPGDPSAPPQIAQVNAPPAAPASPPATTPATPTETAPPPTAPLPGPAAAVPGVGAGKPSAAKDGPLSAARAAVAPPAAAPAPKPAASAATTAAPPPGVSAKKLFVDNATRNAGLRYTIVQQTSGGDIEVDPDTTFHSGDRVRIVVEPNLDGFLYLLHEGSSGRPWDTLFPGPNINGGRNAVRRGQKYSVPPQGFWLKFDETPGTERALVLLSKEPMSFLPGYKEPVTRPESVELPVVEQARNSVKARDLVIEKEQPIESAAASSKSTFVVNRNELAESVSVTIQLVHQK